MYCSSCGIEVTHELNYCNRCGANLNPPVNFVPQMPSAPVKLTGPAVAFGATVVLSIVAIFAGANNLALRDVHPAAIAWMVIIGLATIFGVAALSIRLLSRLLLANSSAATAQPQPQPAQMRRPQAPPQLPSPQTGPMQAPIPSVTDHTTRTFEPAHRERARRERGS